MITESMGLIISFLKGNLFEAPTLQECYNTTSKDKGRTIALGNARERILEVLQQESLRTLENELKP